MSAPSFSSFPPSFTSFPDLDAGPSTRTAASPERKEKERKQHKNLRRDEDRTGDSARSKRKHRHDKHRERDDSQGVRHRVHSRTRSRSRSLTRREPYGGGDDERRKIEEDRRYKDDHMERSAKEGLVYFTDRKGDPLNIQYGGLHAGDVPKYHLVDWGRKVLGLSPALSVVHRGRGGLEVGPFGRRKIPALTDSSSRHILAAPPKRRLLASSEDRYKYSEVDGFIRIATHRPRKSDQSYREIEVAKQDLDSDESEQSEESASSGDESDTTPVTSLQSTLKSLEERLTAEPQDIRAWLSLLSHTVSTVPITSKNAPRARAEIALSVLERALSAHPNNKRSKTLRLRYLKAGEEIWQAEKLKAEWEDAVKVDDMEIWMAWLDWRVRNTSRILESIVEDTTRVSSALAARSDEVGQLRVLWRAAVALRDAGYVERANALFQAQAEFLYNVPGQLSGRPFEELLDALEEFWDSEVARLGEPGAVGWAAWYGQQVGQVPTPSRKHSEIDPRISDPYARWAASEALADHTHTLSLRSVHDDEGSDPYAVVLFSDIRPLLRPLQSSQAQDVFRRVWISFVGLHIPGFLGSLSAHPGDNTDDRWSYSYLVSQSHLAFVLPSDVCARRITADAHAGALVGREREFGSGFGPVKDWGYETVAPLDTLGSGKWMMWTNEDMQGVDAVLVREIFKGCRVRTSSTDWDLLNLAFEAAVSLKGALRASKSLLASMPDSLPHWAFHARLEQLRGRLDDARKVYQTVLTASTRDRPGASALWWDWAQMEWLARNEDVALQVILRSTGVEGSGGVTILRARRYYETLLGQQTGASWKEHEPWVRIAALLELLTTSLPSALALLDTRLNVLDSGSPAHESLTVASLTLVYNHAVVLTNPMPPALLRERVENAIEVYPNNTAVLGMFLEAEKGQGIWGRVRALLGETTMHGTGKEKGIARRVAEVWIAGWEKGRWEAEVERTRSGLSAAVEDDRTRGSAVLWKLFVAFEIRAGQPERAKKLLFRAVGECPLAKELYLLAFGSLRAVFSARELNQWADTMAERGVRMRVGLDEVVGDWTEDNRMVEERRMREGEGSDDDEIEYNARELRRLMPY